jgi:hypothetical protein
MYKLVLVFVVRCYRRHSWCESLRGYDLGTQQAELESSIQVELELTFLDSRMISCFFVAARTSRTSCATPPRYQLASDIKAVWNSALPPVAPEIAILTILSEVRLGE